METRGRNSNLFSRLINKARGLTKGKHRGANSSPSSQTDQQPQLLKRPNDQDSPYTAKISRNSTGSSAESLYEDPPLSESPLNPLQTSQTDTREHYLPQSKAPSYFLQTPQNHQDCPESNLLLINGYSECRSKYWEIAWNTLSADHKSVLEAANMDKENLEQQLKDLRGRMNMVPSFNGLSTPKPVMIRAKINQILNNLQRFSQVVGHGSALHHDLDPNGCVWAGVTFALNLAVQDIKMFEAISNAVDRMTTLLYSCEIYDKISFQQKNQFTWRVLNSIPPIYATSLQLTATALLYAQKLTPECLIGEVLKSFEQDFDSISKEITERKSQFEKLALEAQYSTSSNALRHVERQKQQQILHWLSPVKPRDNHNYARRNRAVGSGEWLFQKSEFVRWMEVEDSSVLWLYGKAGAGKTVLSSTIIDSLLATYPDTPVLYFYCHYKEEARQQQESILRTLYRDLAAFAANDTLDEALMMEYERWESHGRSPPPLGISKVEEFFSAEASKYNLIFLVIDALDECDNDGLGLVKYLTQSLPEGAKHCQSKIFFTSRHDNKIQALLGAKLKYEINANDTWNDIRPFIEQRVKDMTSEKQLLSGNVPAGMEKEIIEALCEKAGGVFLWVDFQLQSIGELADTIDIRLQLQKLPDDLEETYARMMARIEKKPAYARRWAYRALAWVLGTKEFLSPEQLIQATAIQVGSKTVCFGDFPSSVEYLVDLCCHMIVIDRSGSGDTIRFVHFSVQEFLAGHAEFQSVGQLCGATCLTAIGIYQNDEDTKSQHELISSFYIYAARYAMQYADSIEHMPYHELVALLNRINLVHLISCKKANQGPYTSERQAGTSVIRAYLKNRNSKGFVYLLAYFNLVKGLEYETGTSLANSDMITTLMVIALARGNTKCVQVLLGKGFDVNSTLTLGNNEITALHLVCYHLNTKLELARLIIEAGARVNLQAGTYGTALQAAASQLLGAEEVVKLLLGVGADVNLQGGKYGTALQAAASYGAKGVVKLLLEAGAKVNLRGGRYGTPLQAAASFGGRELVKLLLEAGADVNLQGGEYGTALQAAAYYGFTSVVKLLLDAGADVNIIGGKYGTALRAARADLAQLWGYRNAKICVVKMLVDAGAEQEGCEELEFWWGV